MAISDRINYLIETKTKFKDRLNSLGAEIINSTTFRNYMVWVNDFYNKVSDKTYLAETGIVGRTSQNTAILPSEYTQVDYIQSSGTQYIDTGVNADNKLSIKTELSGLSQDSYQGSMSGDNTTNRVRHHLQVTNTGNVVYWAGLKDGGCSTTIITGTNYDSSKKYNIFADIYNQKYYLDGNEISGHFNSNNFDTGLNYYLFGRNINNVASNIGSMKMYSCKMYYNNVLVRDFIPCYRNSDNEVGLYDLVNDVFYTNQGTGVFTYGSVVGIPNPDYPQPINILTGNLRFTIGKEEESENLFDDSTKNNTWIAKSGDSIFHDRQPGANCIEFNCASGDTYTLSATFSETGGAIVICFADANSNYLDYQLRNDSQTMTITATAPENATIMYAGHNYKIPTSITLVKGSGSGGSSKTFNIPLGDIELCGMDAYKDKIYSSNGRFYWDKKIGKVILNGSESWNISTNFWTASVNDYAYSNNIPYSNYFKGVINQQAVTSLTEDNTLAFKNRSGEPRLYIKSSSFTTATEFKNWLSTHNLIIYYALRTPTTTEITSSNYPELYSALKEVQDYLTQYKINKEFLLDYSSPEITY